MNRIIRPIQDIANNSSRLSKAHIISQNADNELFVNTLKAVYSPYCKTNIGARSLNKALEDAPTPVFKTSIEECVAHMLDGAMSSSTACLEYACKVVLSQETDEAKQLAKDIITQDLKLGVGVSTINEALGYVLIKEIKCMLGTPHEKVKLSGQYIITEKHDGIRRLIVKDNDGIQVYSRSGLPYNNIPEIVEEISYLPNGVYDGELLAKGNFKDNHALRQATNSLAAKKGDATGLEFVMFDCLMLPDFFENKFKYNAMLRKLRAINILGETLPSGIEVPEELIMCLGETSTHKFEHIRTSPLLGITASMDEALVVASSIWKRGGEGVMLLSTKSLYQNKRSKDLVKIKNVKDYDLPIVDFIEGEGQFAGMLGAFVVNYKGYRVGVGTGLTAAERKQYWDDRESLIGTIIEIESLGETSDMFGNTSLNCAVFKGLRPDKNV